ncbi:hypothetical protein AVEN_212952-1 [Araneus ventricosus]|uniref:Uncharacterized protein n=1 Tax=Araneus ventricosus TaxID=182803 RepID=A0A4Y2LUQ7_ARAVE|nr:hypothetical protein AVEN_212952-1 [Araneus ventricosus]
MLFLLFQNENFSIVISCACIAGVCNWPPSSKAWARTWLHAGGRYARQDVERAPWSPSLRASPPHPHTNSYAPWSPSRIKSESLCVSHFSPIV